MKPEPAAAITVRQKHNIPNTHHYSTTMPNGDIVFSFCDEDISVHVDGTATRSWMGFSPITDQHHFYEEEWCSQ